MSKKLEIKQVKVYQSVKFENGEHSYFVPAQYKGQMKMPVMEIEELENGSVIVRSAKDIIKAGHANVAYIQYAEVDDTPTKKTK